MSDKKSVPPIAPGTVPTGPEPSAAPAPPVAPMPPLPPLAPAPGGHAPKAQLTKVLPTDRVVFSKQMAVLRAYAAASGNDHASVSNGDVAKVLNDLVASSVGLCNPFLVDAGLLIRDGSKQRPADEVFNYLHAYEWNAETAGMKLRRLLNESWAAKVLLPKLSFRSLTKDEAIQFLADESKASKGHRKNLEILLEYLNAGGVVRVEGNAVNKSSNTVPDSGQPEPQQEGKSAKSSKGNTHDEDVANVHRLELPIPGKPSVVVLIPKSLDAEDWTMFQQMFSIYVGRWKGFQPVVSGTPEKDKT